MTAEEFLELLETRKLVPGETIATLRQQVQKSIKIVPADAVAKLLVEKKRLTAKQAEELLKPPAPAAAAKEDFGLAPLDDAFGLAPMDDPFGLAPIDEPKKTAAAAPAAKTAPATAKPAPAGAAAKPAAAKSPAAAAPKGVAVPAAKACAAAPKKAAAPLGGGPLDDLLSDPSLADAGLASAGSPLGATPRRRSKNAILWLGSAAGAALLILCATLGIVLTRSNGDPEWAAVEKTYQASADNASLQDSVLKLNAFMERFPDQSHVGLAAEYRDLARLRQAFATKTDWSQPLAVAEEVLPQMLSESDFPKVRESVAKMLPEMALGLAKQAKDGAKGPLELRQRQVQQALAGLALAEDWRYAPEPLRPWAQLQAAGDDVAALARAAARDAEMQQSSAAIRASLAAGAAADAIARRDQLCDAFPELRGDATIDTLDDELVAGEAKAVKVDTQLRPADTKPRSSAIAATMLLAVRGASETSVAADTNLIPVAGNDTVVAVQFAGTVYWLNKSDGACVARQFVGFDVPLPAPIADAADNAFILFDGVHQELCRFAVADQAVKWRQPLGDALAGDPLISGNRVLAASQSGTLFEIELNTGALQRTVQFPERLASGPMPSADGASVLLRGERGNQFTLALKDFSVTAARSAGSPPAKINQPTSGNIVARIVDRGGGAPLLCVAAGAKSEKRKWEVLLGAPIVSEPIVNADGSVQCLDALAGFVKVAPKASQPFATELLSPAAVPLNLRGGLVTPFDKDNLLIINDANQVALIATATGQPAAVPFQPRMAPGGKLAWRRPAVLAGKTEAIVTDGVKAIYRLALKTDPIKHLEPVAESPLAVPLVSPVAALDAAAFAVDENRNLLAFGVADLKITKSWPLEAGIVWGPVRAGDAVLLATESELICIDNRPDIAWRKPLTTAPVGEPLVAGDNFVLSTVVGALVQFDRKTGEDRGQIDVGQPLAGGPVESGKQWLVVGHDGSLLWIEHSK
jgi:outer membrane protein assembly factor BamB